jgi:hypothetical protein
LVGVNVGVKGIVAVFNGDWKKTLGAPLGPMVPVTLLANWSGAAKLIGVAGASLLSE